MPAGASASGQCGGLARMTNRRSMLMTCFSAAVEWRWTWWRARVSLALGLGARPRQPQLQTMTHLLRPGNARVTAPESLARTPTGQSGTTVSRSDTARASSSPSARSSRSPRNAGRRTCQCSSRGLGNPAGAHSRGCPRSKLWMESRGFLSGPGPVPDRHQTLDEGELAARVPDHAQPDFSRGGLDPDDGGIEGGGVGPGIGDARGDIDLDPVLIFGRQRKAAPEYARGGHERQPGPSSEGSTPGSRLS
jgi:hypothetical protein